MPDHTQLKESLDGGLFAHNKSQSSSLSFLKYDRFVILGTLAMPNYVWTNSVKIVVKKPWQSKLPLLRCGRFFSDTLGMTRTSWQHTKSGVLCRAFEVCLHTKNQNDPACLS